MGKQLIVVVFCAGGLFLSSLCGMPCSLEDHRAPSDYRDRDALATHFLMSLHPRKHLVCGTCRTDAISQTRTEATVGLVFLKKIVPCVVLSCGHHKAVLSLSRSSEVHAHAQPASTKPNAGRDTQTLRRGPRFLTVFGSSVVTHASIT